MTLERQIVGVDRMGRPIRRSNEVDRFWSKVDKNGPIPEHVPDLGACWIWTSGLTSKGYGLFAAASFHSRLAHRYSYALANGPFSLDLLICHRCDNPVCVRPDHLFAGSYQDNASDMAAKGRTVTLIGEASPQAVLSDDDVDEIRRLAIAEASNDDLAAQFGISSGHVSRILCGSRRPHGALYEKGQESPSRARRREMHDRIESLYLSGMNQSEVGAAVGCDPSVVSRTLKRRGTSVRPMGRRLDFDEAPVVEMLRLGIGLESIAISFGVSNTAIAAVRDRYGIPPNPVGRRKAS